MLFATAASDAVPRQSKLRPWWRDFLPARMQVSTGERWRVALGAALGLLAAAWAGQATHHLHPGLPWLIAPLGASAVLVFGLPASPLAQPWAVVAGNTLSTLVAVACVHATGPWPWVGALAVGLAILLMFALRCMHPPGGACALLAALSDVPDAHFAVFPVLVNSVALVAVGIVYNRLTGRRYPHGQRPVTPTPTAPRARFSEADLDAVLARYNQVLDVPRDDLQQLLQEAELQAYQRRLGTARCADVMSSQPLTVEYGTPLEEAWGLLRVHRIKALPVIDRARRVIGIVTLADFVRSADLGTQADWHRRLRALIRATRTAHTDKPEAVGQIMTRQVRVVRDDRPIAELVPLFADTGHHHIPVIDAERRLVGILTESDVVRALSQAG